MAFTVGCNSEECTKGGHLSERERGEVVVEMKRGREGNLSGSYTNISFTRRIYEEKTVPRVDHRLGENSTKCLHNPL